MERESARIDRLMRGVARSLHEGGEPLTDRQRALIWGILNDLVRSARRVLADAAASTGLAGRIATARDETVEALLARGGTFRDLRLVRLAFARTDAHLLSESLRAHDIDMHDTDEAKLLEPESRARYREAAVRRVDAYGDPRLPIEELPSDLFENLHWEVAAALRTLLTDGPGQEADGLDDEIEAAVARVLKQPPPLRETDRLARRDTIPPEALVKALGRGEVFLFQMLLGQMSGLTLGQIQTISFGRGEVEFATLCRGLDLPRAVFAELHLLVAQHAQKTVRDPEAFATALRTFDAIDPAEARLLLRAWRRHPYYAGALRRMAEA